MKKYLFAAVTISLLLSGTALNAEKVKGEKTILDYYLMVPDSYFQCETDVPLSSKNKLALIKKKNLKKGYIQAKTSDGGLPMELALFTDDYMGIKVLAVNVRCQSGCMCRRLDFFFISDGKLLKKEEGFIFPKIEEIEKAAGVNEGYEFILSEDGSGIKVTGEENGKTLLMIGWSGGTFYIR